MVRNPGTRSVYIATTRGTARQILWDGVLTRLRQRYKLPIQLVTRDGQLMVEHANGSSLWIAGCDDKSECEKFRGQALFRVVIDEAQAFPDFLEYLVNEVLAPTLADYGGELALAGTPSPRAIGYFFDVTTGTKPGWDNHHWTILDNPFKPDGSRFAPGARDEYLRGVLELNGWTEDHPTYQREWMGRWVEDMSALVYPFTHAKNEWRPVVDQPFGLPAGEYSFGLGVDLGFGERSTAFVLAASRIGHQELYLLKAYKRSRMIPTAVAEHVASVRAEFTRLGKPLRVIVDEGALGKGYAEQMRAMGVGCEPAQKTEKRAYQEWLQGLILSGAVKVNYGECMPLLEEARILPFDAETGLEDENYLRHCCDAFLYNARALMPRVLKMPEAEPEPGSAEAIRREMQRLKAEHLRARERGTRRY